MGSSTHSMAFCVFAGEQIPEGMRVLVSGTSGLDSPGLLLQGRFSRMDGDQTWEPDKVRPIEGEDVGDPMDEHGGREARIVHLGA